MANNTAVVAKNQVERLKNMLGTASVQEQFKNALAENSGVFVASIIDLYTSDNTLMQCNPGQVVMEALKAATLKLPINKQLGFAYLVPYKTRGQYVPQFQLGYRGYIQLAMRTGQYKNINAGLVYEGIKVNRDILTGDITFTGEPTSEKAQGYFAYMELLNGFKKTVYMTTDEMIKHAKKYGKSYNYESSAWHTNFDEMAEKTVIRKLLSHYGYLTPDMVAAFSSDKDGDTDTRVADEMAYEANSEVIDIEPEDVEIQSEENGQVAMQGPEF